MKTCYDRGDAVRQEQHTVTLTDRIVCQIRQVEGEINRTKKGRIVIHIGGSKVQVSLTKTYTEDNSEVRAET